MEPWYSGAVTDAVREAKSRRGIFLVYVRDDSENSQLVDRLWTECWTKIVDRNRLIALRLDKDSEACSQFMAIYRVQTYPTVYLINGQNGQVFKMIDQSLNSSEQLEESLRDALNKLDLPVTENVPVPRAVEQKEISVAAASSEESTSTKSIDEKVAEARARLKEIQDKREEEAKEKEKQDEIVRRRLGQQMLLDKQKKEEELLRQQAEELRRDRLEKQQLQAKLKAQIEQDREEKRRKYEEQFNQSSTKKTSNETRNEVEKVKTNYSRSRLQFRLTDGSFFTEEFSCDARMNEVFNYLQETLPTNQYSRGNYFLRAIHTRINLTQENPQTLNELELVPSAVLLVIPRTNGSSNGNSSNGSGSLTIFRPISLFFVWLFAQLTFFYRFLTRNLFGNRTTNNSNQSSTTTNSTRRTNDVFRSESTETSTIRRFRNTQDDQDDEDDEKRTWNGNSTQQM